MLYLTGRCCLCPSSQSYLSPHIAACRSVVWHKGREHEHISHRTIYRACLSLKSSSYTYVFKPMSPNTSPSPRSSDTWRPCRIAWCSLHGKMTLRMWIQAWSHTDLSQAPDWASTFCSEVVDQRGCRQVVVHHLKVPLHSRFKIQDYFIVSWGKFISDIQTLLKSPLSSGWSLLLL